LNDSTIPKIITTTTTTTNNNNNNIKSSTTKKLKKIEQNNKTKQQGNSNKVKKKLCMDLNSQILPNKIGNITAENGVNQFKPISNKAKRGTFK
jgi:chorismate mutase